MIVEAYQNTMQLIMNMELFEFITGEVRADGHLDMIFFKIQQDKRIRLQLELSAYMTMVLN